MSGREILHSAWKRCETHLSAEMAFLLTKARHAMLGVVSGTLLTVAFNLDDFWRHIAFVGCGSMAVWLSAATLGIMSGTWLHRRKIARQDREEPSLDQEP